jgi:hypothetical protein
MDPTQCLKEIREMVAELLKRDNSDPRQLDASISDMEDLVPAIAALDQWLTRGGFLPKQWEYKKTATK